jgi:LCP family protein required for cell wall assembly
LSDAYAVRNGHRDALRGNERQWAYRVGRAAHTGMYGRWTGEVHRRNDGGVELYGRGTFTTPVDPWETNAATDAWFTLATGASQPASRSDKTRRSDTVDGSYRRQDRHPTGERKPAGTHGVTDDLNPAGAVGVTDELSPDDALGATEDLLPTAARGVAEAPDRLSAPNGSYGTIYLSATATATFASPEPTARPRGFAVGTHRKRPARAWTARRHGPIWARLLIGLGALIMIVSVGAMIIVKLGLTEIDHAIPTENLLGDMAAKPVAPAGAAVGPSIKGPINFLLVGVDTRLSGNTGSHSDTIIIAHVPASHDRVYLVSIPRDTNATIPADRKTQFGGGSYKINAAFTFGSRHGGGEAGGFQLLAKTIKNAYGITFNGAAIVNFDGFTEIVNKLGGVNMYIDETTVSIHHGTDHNGERAKPYKIDPNTGVPICASPKVTFDSNPLACALPGVTPVVYPKGQRHLTAFQALDFVRSRDGLVGTDYARQRHQQQFIKAVLTEVYQKGLSEPLRMGSFLTSLGKAFVFDGGGVSLQDWLFALKGITPGSMITIKTNDGKLVNYRGPANDARQSLNPMSLQLLHAVRDDASNADMVEKFIAAHPDWVAQS